MTSHPKDASQKLFDTMASSPKIAPCFHLPFQAGSDRVLKAMNRVYDRAGYLDKVRRLRQAIPDVVITSDVIVGFPGETAEDFEQTMTLIDQVRFDALFTFIFSPREGTPPPRWTTPSPRREGRPLQRLVGAAGSDLRGRSTGPTSARPSAAWWTEGRQGPHRPHPRQPAVRLTGDDSLIGRFVDV